MSDNSNSSCDSDQLQQGGSSYHDSAQALQRGGIPVHRNESISISDMEKYATDVEVSCYKTKSTQQSKENIEGVYALPLSVYHIMIVHVEY